MIDFGLVYFGLHSEVMSFKKQDGFSPLHLAVRNKHKDVCHLLLKEKVEVNIEDTNLRFVLKVV